jgi:hypothetical protein
VFYVENLQAACLSAARGIFWIESGNSPRKSGLSVAEEVKSLPPARLPLHCLKRFHNPQSLAHRHADFGSGTPYPSNIGVSNLNDTIGARPQWFYRIVEAD